ncbi:MAG: Na(+)/H(+) antiporter subunit D [Thiotrichales bacterium]|nr:MAG: Na(+)/H(+) antiporter subunit D [Thiotrichales bacterium]
MWIDSLPPFAPFYIAALLALIARGRLQSLVMLAAPVLGGLHLWLDVSPGIVTAMPIMEYELVLMRTDRLSLVFGYIFHIAAFVAVIYSLHTRDTSQKVSSLFYAGSALGAVFAGDLITLFIFWELLALSSVFLIWASRTERAIRSGTRYLLIQVSSGMLLLAGALIRYHQTGSLEFDFIGLEGLSGLLIFLAFGIKCAFPLLHNWLTDAYPEATPSGAVFLSVFTTKTAVYALARGYPGTEILIYIGAVMTCFPIFFAVIENDLRRVLAYSLINQLGFMVCGIGIGTALALNGTVAHAFSHILYKALLFMSMGAILYRAGTIKASDLGGLYKSMPKTAALCIVGACSISAFPLFSGFVSKSMILAAMLEEGHDYLWLVLLFASAGVVHHAGIKVPYFGFFAKDSGIRTQEAPLNMLVAMSIAAALCIFIGVQPLYLYALLPWEVEYWPYEMTHVLSQMQLLLFAALAFGWLNKLGLHPPEIHAVNIDVEWLYRKLIPKFAHHAYEAAQRIYRTTTVTLRRTSNEAEKSMIKTSLGRFSLAASWPTGSMVFWIAVILGAYLLADAIH